MRLETPPHELLRRKVAGKTSAHRRIAQLLALVEALEKEYQQRILPTEIVLMDDDLT